MRKVMRTKHFEATKLEEKLSIRRYDFYQNYNQTYLTGNSQHTRIYDSIVVRSPFSAQLNYNFVICHIASDERDPMEYSTRV
jgi:hypothetical protein